MNLEIDSHICDNLNNIPYKEVCNSIDAKQSTNNSNNKNRTIFLRDILESIQLEHPIVKDLDELVIIDQVCDAEKESQKLITKLYAIRAPIGKNKKLIS